MRPKTSGRLAERRWLFVTPHEYVDRASGRVLQENLFHDRIIGFLYSRVRERSPGIFRAAISRQTSWLFGYLQFDLPLAARLFGNRRFLESVGVNWDECLEDPHTFTTPREIFERKIRFEQCRPTPDDPSAILAPADSRVIVGSLENDPQIRIKDKFFNLHELLGGRTKWIEAFKGGSYAIFRLTPEQYHYNHTPVSGSVKSHYSVYGCYHSCNPSAVVEVATPYSKNRRDVTIFQTDSLDGSCVGWVAMIEVVALMIGDIVQCYSDQGYEGPMPMAPGLLVRAGRPKSLFRPGSSTTILLFQRGRVTFSEDLLRNRLCGAHSRFSLGFAEPLVETQVKVRSAIAVATRRRLHEHVSSVRRISGVILQT